MADKMPAREFFVGIDSYIWYISGRQTARDVFVDDAGNLLEAPPAYSPDELYKRLDKITGFAKSLRPPDDSDMSSGNVEAGGNADAPVVIMTPLNAGYTATLPKYLTRCYDDGEITETIKTYIGGLGAEGSNIFYADLTAGFSGSDIPLYYRTDHHWNGDGAYLAYTALGDALGFTPLPKNNFSIEEYGGFYGSTYAKSGLWFTRPDTIAMWSPPVPVLVSVTDAGKEPDVRESLFFNEYLSDWDMYSVFLGGIHGLTVIDNLDGNQNGKTLFIIKDSYANSLIPLLVPHFDRIVVVDLRYYRESVSELYGELHSSDDDALLFIYSMNHMVNDPDMMWLR